MSTTTTETTVRTLPNRIGGKTVLSQTAQFQDVENPATGDLLCRVPLSTPGDVASAVEAAHRAYRSWRSEPASRRVDPLYQLAARIKADEERVARVLTEEMGKSLPDARAEVRRTYQNVEAACGMPILQQGDKLIGAAPGIDGETIRLPRGVHAVIAPFNFPAMVPFWFLPYAVATGNTVVVKPSELVPRTMDLLAEMLAETDLPPGVVNIVHGSAEAAEALIDDERVVGVSMVGSSKVARSVASRCAAAGKRFQAMGGAKNHLVVMPDAKLDEVVRNMVTSCYGCAGQRCMAASAVVAVGDATYREVCERFVQASEDVIVADPLDPAVADEPIVMGPVISAKAKQFILDMIERGVREGATLAYDRRNVDVPGGDRGHYVGPVVLTDVKPGMQVHQTEIFGPVVVILRAQSLDEAIGIINDHPYGNGASIYTQNGYWARRFKIETLAGMIGINVGIPAPVAFLPFGGMKQSLFSGVKAQGKSVVDFFTEEKVITERYWDEA